MGLGPVPVASVLTYGCAAGHPSMPVKQTVLSGAMRAMLCWTCQTNPTLHPNPVPVLQDLLVHCEQQVMRFVLHYLHSTLVDHADVEAICNQVCNQQLDLKHVPCYQCMSCGSGLRPPTPLHP